MLSFVWRNALRRGLLGGDRRWMAVFAVIGVAKVVRKLGGGGPETVFVGELKPGSGLVITHLKDEPGA